MSLARRKQTLQMELRRVDTRIEIHHYPWLSVGFQPATWGRVWESSRVAEYTVGRSTPYEEGNKASVTSNSPPSD
jgi:hypothetical protein